MFAFVRNSLLVSMQAICFPLFSQNAGVVYESVVVQRDFVHAGSKGFYVSGKCDIQSYRETYSTDSLMFKAFRDNTFYLTITPLQQDSLIIKSAIGYNTVFPDENIGTSIKWKPTRYEVRAGKMNFSWFVPYAAMKLNAVSQEVTFRFKFSGKDGFNKDISAEYKTDKISFVKPKTRICEIQFDSLRVNARDVNGKVWDANISGIDKPDLDWSIFVGDKKINSLQKGNCLSMSCGEKPTVFKFTISEDDEIYINLVDEDEFIHDQIANWRYISAEMLENIAYKQEDLNTNVAAFSFSCKLGPVK